MEEEKKGVDKKAKDKPEQKEEVKTEEKSGQSSWLVIGIIVIVAAFLFYSYGDSITGKVVSVSTVNESSNVIKIGFMGPLTGDASSYGQAIKKGAELAFEEANLENVKLVFQDSKCDSREAVSAVNKLINSDGVVAIIGEVCSGATLAAAPIAESKKVVMVSPSSTSPKITKSGDFIFRTVPSDVLQGAYASNLLYKKGYKKLAILYSNEEYGVGFKDILEDTFKGEIVASETFDRGAVDLRTQITKIKSAKPSAIFIISNSPDSSVAAIKQIKELGVVSKLYGSEGLKGPEVAQTKGAEGLIVTSVSVGTFEFGVKYEEEYGEEPGPFAAQGYDAFSAVARAMKNGAKTGEEIKNSLYGTSFDGASGRISFDLNGDIAGNYEVYQLKKGEWNLIE